MGNSIFDWLIERGHVQGILIVAAALWVVGVFVYGRVRRGRGQPAAQPFLLLLGCLGPLALGLWFVYNTVMDRLGLDSLLGLGVNLVLFLATGLLVGLLFRRLDSGAAPENE